MKGGRRSCGSGATVCASCSAASRLQPSQIQAQPHSYLFHKLRSKCRCWQIRPGSGTALLQQLLSRNSPSMPCWGWGKELKDSWAGFVVNSLLDWCPTWLIMSQLKRRQEKGKHFQTHHFLFISLCQWQTAREFSIRMSFAFTSTLSCEEFFGTWEERENDEIIDKTFGSRSGSLGGLAPTVDSRCLSVNHAINKFFFLL